MPLCWVCIFIHAGITLVPGLSSLTTCKRCVVSISYKNLPLMTCPHSIYKQLMWTLLFVNCLIHYSYIHKPCCIHYELDSILLMQFRNYNDTRKIIKVVGRLATGENRLVWKWRGEKLWQFADLLIRYHVCNVCVTWWFCVYCVSPEVYILFFDLLKIKLLSVISVQLRITNWTWSTTCIYWLYLTTIN